ncbi:hypothetical protein GCM10028803_08450 [Larkinella knui]|uniref:Nuclear transport factor 2 family protein n=1 Tax=Larkinella knui TaxID=2025310 RepID=A0A3P1CKQ8_9BACT|nr:hypothetical protein [Larkinella knui]RRB13494.1 hypothetical protein EHT87_14580 [Larkinella knui]
MPVFLTLGLLLICLGTPPFPWTSATVQADYEALVAAELGFAQMALDRGIRDAFVENLDEQSVIFIKNRFLPGKSTYQRLPPSSGRLTWRPNYAEISASGTMGFTTGPFEFRPRTMDEDPVSYGQFTSVWHKTAAGDWKALIDFGCTHAKPDQPVAALQMPGQFGVKTNTVLDTTKTGRELRQAETEFIRLAHSQSLRGAYQAVLPASDSVRLLREGNPVYTGTVAREKAASSNQKIDFQLVQVMTASSGDFGFTYGYATIGQIRNGYLRIWRKRQGAWQLAHEVLGVQLM